MTTPAGLSPTEISRLREQMRADSQRAAAEAAACDERDRREVTVRVRPMLGISCNGCCAQCDVGPSGREAMTVIEIRLRHMIVNLCAVCAGRLKGLL